MKIEKTATAGIVTERSRFHAVIFPASGEEDLLKVLRLKKGEHRKACHHCWALRYREESGRIAEKSKDDGEVGHPGKVLLEILRREELEGAILVSRIFGGVKLGVGGVSRAFRQAGEEALKALLAE